MFQRYSHPNGWAPEEEVYGESGKNAGTIMCVQACGLHWAVGPWPADLTSGPPSLVFYWPRLATLGPKFKDPFG